MPRAKAAALKALDLNPTLAEARGWLATATMLYDWDWAQAEGEFRRATESQPENSRAHLWYAIFLGALGRHDESIPRILQAQALDPLSLPIHQNVARCYVWARKYDQALDQLRVMQEMEPGHPLSYAWIARALCGKHLFREALEELAQGMAVAGRSPLLLALSGHAYGELGMRSEALGVVEELRNESTRRYVSPFLGALVVGSLGDLDEAFRMYDLAYEQRTSDFAFLRVSHICLPEETSPVRSDPRFTALLKRVKLEA
jgi:tetratricopeptide (TPR) repeat protein